MKYHQKVLVFGKYVDYQFFKYIGWGKSSVTPNSIEILLPKIDCITFPIIKNGNTDLFFSKQN